MSVFESERLGVTVRVPNSWRVTELPERDVVILHPVDETYDEKFGPEGFTKSLVLRVLDERGEVNAAATSLMSTYVVQGVPDEQPFDLPGLSGKTYDWSDGAARVATWIFQAPAGRRYEAHFTLGDPPAIFPSSKEARRQGTSLLSSVGFHVTSRSR